jgi:hypothetical protein
MLGLPRYRFNQCTAGLLLSGHSSVVAAFTHRAFISNELSSEGDCAMRFVRMAWAAAGSLFEFSRIARLTGMTATVLAATVAVLLASFVAVAVGLT